MIARMGKPQTNAAVKTPPKPSQAAVTTAFSKGAQDEKEAAEARAAADRRDALKSKTADMLARKKERMNDIAKMNQDAAMLNATAAALYGTEGEEGEEGEAVVEEAAGEEAAVEEGEAAPEGGEDA